MKELYRAVVQRRPILAMLEPDTTQEGGLTQKAIVALMTDKKLDRFGLRKKWKKWKDEGELLPAAFDHAPNGKEVADALFATNPVEWNRLPHFQDVTIRLIAQNGVLHGSAGELYLQGEAATGTVTLPPPFKDRKYHLFCSAHNAGALELATELRSSGVIVKGELTFTDKPDEMDQCDHMLVLLDDRTWKSGETTDRFVADMERAMRLGVHMQCTHEFPSVVGPPRHACEFALMFNDDWTPPHLSKGDANLYKEIALALKGVEWRKPGLVALASKLAPGGAERAPVDVEAAIAALPPREETAPQPQDLPPPPSGTAAAPTETAPAPSFSVKMPSPAKPSAVDELSDRLKGMFSPAAPAAAPDAAPASPPGRGATTPRTNARLERAADLADKILQRYPPQQPDLNA